MSVGALPSEKVAVLIKKYGTNGSRLAAQKAALELLAAPKTIPDPGEPASLPKPKAVKGAPAENGSTAAAAETAPTETAAAAPAEAAPEAAATEGTNGSE